MNGLFSELLMLWSADDSRQAAGKAFTAGLRARIRAQDHFFVGYLSYRLISYKSFIIHYVLEAHHWSVRAEVALSYHNEN